MPAVRISTGASGLPPNIVEQIIEAEKLPIKTMEQRKTRVESRLNLVTDLESKLSEVQKTIGTLADTRGFNDIKVVSGDKNIIDGVVDPQRSVPGSWNVEIMQLPNRAAAVSNGFPDRDKTELGVGYIKFDTVNGSESIYIDGNNSTLQGVANKINQSGMDVQASVINDRKDPDYPYKLILSGKSLGDENQVNYPTLYFLDGDQDFYWDENREAKNGVIKIDGIEMEVADTVLKDVIPGVTLELRQASPGRSINITVKEDMEVVSGKIKTFVDALNTVFSFIQQQNRLDEKSDTSSSLGGDSLLRRVEGDLHRLIQNPQYGVGGSVDRLNQLGITFNRNGTLDFNQEKFNARLATDPSAVQRFFAGDGFSTGFIPSLRRTIGNALNQSFGPIAQRKQGLRQEVSRIDQRIDNTNRMIERKEESLRRKFARLDETVSRLKSQGSAIAGGALGSIGGGGALGGGG